MNKIIETIILKTDTIKNKKYLSCSNAFKIAAQFNIDLSDIGNICNKQNIKIQKCQLGCF